MIAPTTKIVGFHPNVSNTTARVVCSISHAGDSRTNAEVVGRSIKAALHNKLEPVVGSFTSLDKGRFLEYITGIVTPVRDIIHVTSDEMTGFRAIASNMFLDEEQNIWKVVTSTAGELLVRTSVADDLELVKLLQSCSASISHSRMSDHTNIMALASSIASQVQGGDFVTYVAPEGVLEAGYVVATATVDNTDRAIVLQVNGDSAETVSTSAVVEIHKDVPDIELSQQERVDMAVAIARSNVSLDTLLDFYKRVYSRSPEFYQMFAARLRSHAFL